MAKERSTDIDLLRGLAMFLVVWGHMLQYTCLARDPFADPLLRLIYMFHMPLLILISGYLSAFSRHTGLRGALRGRIVPLLRVLLVWNLLDYLLRFAYARFLKMDTAFSLADLVQSTVGGLWFVWAVIAYTLISAVAACLPQRWLRALWYTGGAALLYLFPSTQNLLFLYPYFLLGRALPRLPRPARAGKITAGGGNPVLYTGGGLLPAGTPCLYYRRRLVAQRQCCRCAAADRSVPLVGGAVRLRAGRGAAAGAAPSAGPGAAVPAGLRP